MERASESVENGSGSWAESVPLSSTAAERWSVETSPASSNRQLDASSGEFGALEVLVHFDGARVANASVGVRRNVRGSRPDAAPAGSDARNETTDSDGLANIRELVLGHYGVSITLPNGLAARRGVSVHRVDTAVRLIVDFGSACVFGTVYDADGRPAEGAVIELAILRDDRLVAWNWEATSIAGGTYRIEGLPPGDMDLHDRAETQLRRSTGRRSRFELKVGEQRRIDIGSPNALVSWKGRVLTASGRRVEKSLMIWTIERNNDWRDRLPCDSYGTLAAHRHPGTYDVMLEHVPDPLRLCTVDIQDHDFELDLTLPAPIVFGTVRRGSDHADVSTGVVHLDSLDGLHHVASGVNYGRFYAHSVPVATYRVTVPGTRILGQPPEGFVIRVDADSEIELTLELEE